MGALDSFPVRIPTPYSSSLTPPITAPTSPLPPNPHPTPTSPHAAPPEPDAAPAAAAEEVVPAPPGPIVVQLPADFSLPEEAATLIEDLTK